MRARREEWIVVPSSARELDEVRRRCRKLVMQRAVLAAGASAVPLPGVDIAADLSLVTRLLADINREFGLTPEQLLRLSPREQLRAYQAIVAVGSVVVGKVITKDLVYHVLRAVGVRITARQATKVVPLAGQAISAVLGFAALRYVGERHIEACVRVSERLLALPAAQDVSP